MFDKKYDICPKIPNGIKKFLDKILDKNWTTKNFFISDGLLTFFLLAYDPSLAEQITKRPTSTFEILEDAAKQVADEVTRPRPGNEPINPDLNVQLISGAEGRAIRDLSAADVGKLVKIPGIAVSASQVKLRVHNFLDFFSEIFGFF